MSWWPSPFDPAIIDQAHTPFDDHFLQVILKTDRYMETWYWVVEDDFPAVRPPLEKAGVYMTDKDTVNAADQMKVTTCLNSLHTALVVFGMLLGYPTMSRTIADPDLKALVPRLGYVGGPVVEDPGIFSPEEFLRQVIEIRVPNPGLPDAPARISTDTSQKIPVKYSNTISKYIRTEGQDAADLGQGAVTDAFHKTTTAWQNQ